MLRALFEEEFQKSKPKWSKQSKFLSQGTADDHFPKKPYLSLDFSPVLIGLQSWEKLISSKCCAILKHRFVWQRTCMWLVLQGCGTQLAHEHFGEERWNFIVSKIQVSPKSSYPLTHLLWSFIRNPIQLQRQLPKCESNLSETKVKLISNGRYEKREITCLEKKNKNNQSKILHFTCCPNNHKFRCSEHDTEEWHSQTALTDIQFSKPLTTITSLTPILSRLPLRECSRAIISRKPTPVCAKIHCTASPEDGTSARKEIS